MKQVWAGCSALVLAIGLVAVPALSANSVQAGASQPATNTAVAPVDAENLTKLTGFSSIGSSPEKTLADTGQGVQSQIQSRIAPESAPAGHRAEAPSQPAAEGLTFFEDPETMIGQQTPSYPSDAEPIVNVSGDVTGLKINGIQQDYSTQIPYWCDDSTDYGYSLNLCYRQTDLFQGQAQDAAQGGRLSIVNGQPHIIFDDEHIDADSANFLQTGIMQQAMEDWNKLVGSGFFLLKSQTTTDPADTSGKLQIDYARDYVQYLFIKSDIPDAFDAGAGTTGLRLNMKSYNEGYNAIATADADGYSSWGYRFDRTETSGGYVPRGDFVSWGSGACGVYWGKCQHFDTVAEAEQAWRAIFAQNWRSVLDHEFGHFLGLDHPEDPTGTTYTDSNPAGCAPGQFYYNNGPLNMEYMRDNIDAMLDGSISTSVQYRMVKDLIAVGANTIRQRMAQGDRPLTQRKISVNVVDQQGQPASVSAPITTQTQTVGYYGTYSDVTGDTVCGGFQTEDYDQWTPASAQLPAITLPELKGYQVSFDEGKTWSTSATIPAVDIAPTAELQWSYTAAGRQWTDKNGAAVTHFGLTDPAEVTVTYKALAVSPKPEKQPAGDSSSSSGSEHKPQDPPSNGQQTTAAVDPAVNKAPKKTKTVKTAQDPSQQLAATGSDIEVVLSIMLALAVAGIMLLSATNRHRQPK